MREGLLEHFQEQARFCDEYGSPFTAQLIEALAQDIVAGGPTAALVGDWSGPPRGDAVALRMTGALHAAALTQRSPVLAAAYPAARDDWRMENVWPAALAFLADDQDWVAAFIRSAPQTNETRRSIALLAGFLEIAKAFDRPMETLEIGASAGLNLSWDRFSYSTDTWQWGEAAGVMIDTDWRGPPPAVKAKPDVRARAACDLNPLDIRDPDARLRLRSYIWADQPERLARFDAAVALAIANDVQVERASADDWLEMRLARRSEDAVTVVYHSVFLQYPPREVQARIADVIGKAGEKGPAPLVWLRMEPETLLGGPRDSNDFLVDITTWPGGMRRILAKTDGHVRRVDFLG